MHDIISASRSRSGQFSWKSQIRFKMLTDIGGGGGWGAKFSIQIIFNVCSFVKSSNSICFIVNKAINYIEQIVVS